MNSLTIKQLQLPDDKKVIYLDGEELDNWVSSVEIVDILNGAESGLMRMKFHELFDNSGVVYGDSELELIEAYALEHGFADSEEALGALFEEYLEELELKDIVLLEDDEPMLSETWSNWVDGMVSDGELHQLQASDYTMPALDFKSLIHTKARQ